jgi:hypothetical protein
VKLESYGCKFFDWAAGCGSSEPSRSLYDFIASRHNEIDFDKEFSSALLLEAKGFGCCHSSLNWIIVNHGHQLGRRPQLVPVSAGCLVDMFAFLLETSHGNDVYIVVHFRCNRSSHWSSLMCLMQYGNTSVEH